MQNPSKKKYNVYYKPETKTVGLSKGNFNIEASKEHISVSASTKINNKEYALEYKIPFEKSNVDFTLYSLSSSEKNIINSTYVTISMNKYALMGSGLMIGILGSSVAAPAIILIPEMGNI